MLAGRARGGLAILLALAVLAIAVRVAFAPALGAGFVLLDDDYNVLHNPHFRGLARENLLWMASASWNGNYQPLAWLSFALDHALAGLDPARFHGTNVLVHAASAVLLFFLARAIFDRTIPAASSTGRTLGALAAALVFAVHPLRAESVAWVTDRNDLLAGLFAVAAAGCWWRAVAARDGERERGPPNRRAAATAVVAASAFLLLLVATLDTSDPDRLRLRAPGAAGVGLAFVSLGACAVAAASAAVPTPQGRRWYLAACAAFLLSLLSKGAALALPLVLIVLDVHPLRRFTRQAAGRLLVEKVPLLALSLAAGYLAGWAREARIGSYIWVEERMLLQRLAQAVQALAFYPWKTLLPRGLVPIVDVPARARWLDPELLVPALFVLAAAIALVLARRRAPSAVAAFGAYALLVAPALGLVPFGSQLVSDRYSYVACIPLALLAGGAWLAWASSRGTTAKLAWACALAVGVALCAATRKQVSIWRDSESLFTHQLRFDETPRALSNLAIVWNERAEGDPGMREAWLERAEELAVRALEGAKARGVFVPEYRLPLGTILLNRGKVEEALGHLEAFVGERPQNMQGWSNLGLALLRLGRFDEAASMLQRAVSGREASADVWRLLGMAFEGQGRRADAIAAYRRALGIHPGLFSASERLKALEAGR